MPIKRGGRSYAKRGNNIRRNNAKYIKKVAQSVVNNSKETKRHIRETGDEESISVLTGTLVKNLVALSQGDSTFTRDGDYIYAMSFRGSYIITNQNSFPVYVRVMIVSDKTQVFDSATSELFEGVNDTDMTISDARSAGFHVPLMAKINNEKCYVLYDKVVKIDPILTSTVMKNYSVKLNRKIAYDGSDETDPAKHIHSFRLIAIPVDATNDQISGNIEFSGQCHFYFKDM